EGDHPGSRRSAAATGWLPSAWASRTRHPGRPSPRPAAALRRPTRTRSAMGVDYRVKCCPDGLMTDRRCDVRVMDCTIRDGGCCNGWRFDKGLVRRTFEAVSRAGVDLMEIGYWTSP